MMKLKAVLALIAFFLLVPLGWSQQNKPTQPAAEAPSGTYKLTFVVTELSKGKVEGRRTYSALFAPLSDQKGSIRSGNRVPVVTGSYSSDQDKKMVNTQYQYVDVGANFDFWNSKALSGSTHSGQLALRVSANLSSYVKFEVRSGTEQPLIRQNTWSSDFVVGLNKPKLLFSSEDPAADQTTQVELTVTRADP